MASPNLLDAQKLSEAKTPKKKGKGDKAPDKSRSSADKRSAMYGKDT